MIMLLYIKKAANFLNFLACCVFPCKASVGSIMGFGNMLREFDVLTLKRPDVIRFARLTAALTDNTASSFAKLIANETGEPAVENLSRHAIPNSYRVGLFRVFKSLSATKQSAIVEQVFPKQFLARASTPGTDPNDWNEILKTALPGLDLSAFDNSGFTSLPQWPKLEFILLRRIDEGRLRVSYMTIRKNDTAPYLPRFTTLRRNDSGHRKIVHGIALKCGNEIYTVGQTVGVAGLRFSRLQIEQAGDSEEDTQSIALYGLRLGLKAAIRQPFAHVVYGHQIKSEKVKVDKEWWFDRPTGIFDITDENLVNAVGCQSLKYIAGKLKNTADIAGLTPLLPD